MNSTSFQKIWTVIKYEYRHTVFCWRFWMIIFAIPLLLGLFFVVMAIILAFTFAGNEPVAVVDYAGLILDDLPQEKDTLTSAFVLYTNEEIARSALDAKDVQAYYVIPFDFMKNQEVRLVYQKRPKTYVLAEFENLLKRSMLHEVPKERAEKITGRILVIPHLVGADDDSLPEVMRLLFPILAGTSLLFVVSCCTDFIFHAFSEEKSNRTLEILVTSVSPEHLLTGKLLGLSAAGLTQMALSGGMLLFLLPLLLLTRVPLLNSIFSWQNLLVFGLMVIPSIVLMISLVTAMLVMMADPTVASGFSMLLFVLQMIPLAVVSIISDQPNGWVSSGLTYFPVTSLVTIAIRQSYANIEAWQIALSLIVVVVAGVASLRLSFKLFRNNILNVAREIHWKTLPARLFRRVRHDA